MMCLLLFALALTDPLARELPQPNDDVALMDTEAVSIPTCEWGFRQVGNGWVMALRQPLYPLCIQEEGGKGEHP